MKDGTQLSYIEASQQQILESLSSGVVGIDTAGRFIFLNAAAYRLLGFNHKEELLGHNAQTFLRFNQPDGTPLSESEHPFGKVLRTGIPLEGWEGWFHHKDGTRFPVEIFVSRIISMSDLPEGLVVSFSDLRARRALEHIATHDDLTGLYNRSSFSRWLEQNRATNERYGTPFSLIMYDIDYFKAVNDRFGHQAGDRVLRELVLRVNQVLREPDIHARWGGEEFLVLAPHTDAQGAAELGERLREAVAQSPFDHVGAVTISLGVATYESGETVERFEGRVDRALYRAKEAGRNRVVTESHACM